MGYMYKILTNEKMPSREHFKDYLRIYFPKLLDIKTLQECYYSHLRGGLNFISSKFGLTRDNGEMHQAGSDSLITSQLFFKFMEFFSQEDALKTFMSHNQDVYGYENTQAYVTFTSSQPYSTDR